MDLSKMNCPLVSIIVPCYNHEKYINDSLEGLLKQDYDNIEVLIGDDCSKDKSFDLILENKEKLEQKFKRVILIQNEHNLGVTKNLNNLIKKSQGEYIKIIASDDFLAPSAISEFVDFALENLSKLITVSNGTVMEENSTFDNAICIGNVYDISPDLGSENLFTNLVDLNIIAAPCAFYHKSVFERFGLFDENFIIEDYEFWLRVASSKEDIFEFLDKKLIFYRRNENSMTSIDNNTELDNKRIKFHTAAMHILEKYRDKIEKQKFAQGYIYKCFNEIKLAKKLNLDGLYKTAYEELKSFDGWNDLPLKEKIKNNLKMLRYKPHSNEKT